MAGRRRSVSRNGEPRDAVAIVAHQRGLAHIRFAPEESPYRFIAMVPQDVTEKLLAEELGASGRRRRVRDRVRVGGRARRLRERHARPRGPARGAHCRLRGRLRRRAQHGPASPEPAVRGRRVRRLFMLADIQTNDALPADELQLCPSEFGPAAIFPMSATRRRIVATVEPPRETRRRSSSCGRSCASVRPRESRRRPSTGAATSAFITGTPAQLRVGRMFIAGDAAHIHSPFGGQGMNTGLHDAWNLAWKLDLALRGRGNETLLGSYGAERLPVIRHVIETTHRLTKAMGTANRLAQTAARRRHPRRVAPVALSARVRADALGPRGSPIAEARSSRGPASATSTTGCAAERASGAGSCSSSATRRIRAPGRGRPRRGWPGRFPTSSRSGRAPAPGSGSSGPTDTSRIPRPTRTEAA